ncbi:hypothetical protein LRP52_49965 [Photobacterium sp. ZSDE20]|uniref:Uncharacterized protein n=1 Tax=Photobacterium pectinilyticum TaxID=2906793 RepID=A0ABT1N6E1_9GAMM|nr:hypothetical protein [Photobacterium sp. ZSDE20]MCQ1060107.1 hypothetical protein [Photobacterium sp. ZSDE20]MDD1830247.1 hypothetical protein [Photobacterium sp. ZSDE20]
MIDTITKTGSKFMFLLIALSAANVASADQLYTDSDMDKFIMSPATGCGNTSAIAYIRASQAYAQESNSNHTMITSIESDVNGKYSSSIRSNVQLTTGNLKIVEEHDYSDNGKRVYCVRVREKT